MHTEKRTMLLVNTAGGIAVLGSYAYGLTTHPSPGDALWGGVPETLRPLYTVSMLCATAGYFAFSGFFLFAVDPDRPLLGDRFGFGFVNVLYALMLGAAALWMPLTFAMINGAGDWLWLAIRLVLILTGGAATVLLGVLLTLQPRRPLLPFVLAVVGLIAFVFQTAVLDAVVWPAYFRG